LTNKVTLDIQYIGTLSKKLQGSYNINAQNVFFNKELRDAFDLTRTGGDSPLLDQMLAGLNVSGLTTDGTRTYGAIGTCVVQPGTFTGSGLGLEGCASNAVMQHASAQLRRAATATGGITVSQAVASGNYNVLAGYLNGNGTGVTGLTTPPGISTSIGGRLLRNGCDRLGNGQTTVSTALPLPLRCFAENYLVINPQLNTPTFITSSGNQNYHSLQTQVTLRPVHGFSYQATYTCRRTWLLPVRDIQIPRTARRTTRMPVLTARTTSAATVESSCRLDPERRCSETRAAGLLARLNGGRPTSSST
jgi:hypothetical protein